MEGNMNKLAKDFDLKDRPTGGVSKPSDKVPEHAKLVNDDEKLDKELMDLKRRLREINLENLKVQGNLKLIERKQRLKEADLDRIMQEKGLVQYNGRLEANESSANIKGSSKLGVNMGMRLEDIPNYDNLATEKQNPLDSVVKKIERSGYTLDQAFNLFDDNGDQVLTIMEIKDGLRN